MGKNYKLSRDELYTLLRDNNIYSRKYFYPITSNQICFKEQYKMNELQVAEKLSKMVLTLPLYEDLEIMTIKKIVKLIK